MHKLVTVLSILIISAFVAGCGGSSSTDEGITDYTLPTNTTAPIPVGAIAAKFANYTVSTLAGTPRSAGFSNNSTSTLMTTAKFDQPMGITTAGANILYTADFNNSLIRKIDLTKQAVTTLTGLKDSKGTAITLYNPTDIATIGNKLYVVDHGNHAIRIIDTDTGNTVTTIGSTTGVAGAVDSTVAANVRFNSPIGITTDGVNLYVTDSGNNTIRWIKLAADRVTTLAVSTLAGAHGSAGTADDTQSTTGRTSSLARFNLPARITTDNTSLYVTDFNNRTIRKIDILTGAVTTIAGQAGTAPGLDDADADGAVARFYHPNGITTDGKNLYVTDSFNNTIRKISTTAPYKVEKISGITYTKNQDPATGHTDSSDGIPSFWAPTGITTDGTSLYVADSGNHTVRKIK